MSDIRWMEKVSPCDCTNFSNSVPFCFSLDFNNRLSASSSSEIFSSVMAASSIFPIRLVSLAEADFHEEISEGARSLVGSGEA